MNIETSLRIAALPGGESRALAETWPVGAVLPVRLLEQRGTLLDLLLDGQRASAQLPPGSGALPESFRVRVLAAGSQPLLELLDAEAGDALRMEALRTLLPRQQSQTLLLADLQWLDAHPNESARLLPAEVRDALAALRATAPDSTQLGDSERLAGALRRSGGGYEQQLLQLAQDLSITPGTPPLGGDWKAALLRVLQVLARQGRPLPARAETGLSPPPLARQPLHAEPRLAASDPGANRGENDADVLLGRMQAHVQGALARIEIATLEGGTQPLLWLIELPLRARDGYDLLQLRIAQEGHGDETPNTLWRLAFAVDPPRHGAIEGEIVLRSRRVQVQLRVARAATQRLLEAGLPRLAAALTTSGLLPERLQCSLGLREPARLGSTGLLDATA